MTLHAAQDLASALPPLLVAARQAAAAVAGCHGRRRAGPGDEFWQFRAARPGDDLRVIDWRQSARSPHWQVREQEWAVAARVHLWCDRAATLDWASAQTLPRKGDRGMVLLLALGEVLRRGGERVMVPGLGGQRRLEDLAQALLAGSSLAAGPGMAAGQPLVLVSDFLEPVAVWRQRLQPLAALGLRGHLLQVLDPAEVDFPYVGRVLFHGLDGHPPLLAERADGWRAAYGARLAQHQADMAALAAGWGWSWLTHRTDSGAAPALLALYTRLEGA